MSEGKEIKSLPDKRWVYRGSGDFKLYVKPKTQEAVRDNSGLIVSVVPHPAVWVKFHNGVCVVDESLAHAKRLDVETLVKLIEAQPSFGKQFHLVQSPSMVLSKQEAEDVDKKIEEQQKAPGSKVVHGPRGRSR